VTQSLLCPLTLPDQPTASTVAGKAGSTQVGRVVCAAVDQGDHVVHRGGQAGAVWTAHLAPPTGRLEDRPALGAVTAVVVCLAHEDQSNTCPQVLGVGGNRTPPERTPPMAQAGKKLKRPDC
jgi:hypothetical protein